MPNLAPLPDSLVPWLGGRSEIFGPADQATPSRFDPRHQGSARFFELVRALDRVGWAEPLLRVRPSWVFYDCALVPGALFGYALPASAVPAPLRAQLGVADDEPGLVPVSLLALIPTMDGDDLVQSLSALELPDVPAEALAVATLHDGARRLGVRTLTAAVLWRSSFLARFLELGTPSLLTAWTPAHDEPATVTFAVAPDVFARGGGTIVLDVEDEHALRRLQREIELGAEISLIAIDDTHVTLRRRA